MRKEVNGMYRLNVDMDKDLARELRKRLIDEGRTLADWVRQEATRFLRAGKIREGRKADGDDSEGQGTA